jgi:osmotically-inducible protein OsmY
MRAFEWIGVTTGALLIGLVGVARADDVDTTVKDAEQHAQETEKKARDAEQQARDLDRQAEKAENKAQKAEQDAQRARRDASSVRRHHRMGRAPVKHVQKSDRDSVGTEVSDSWITTKVKASYLTEGALKGSDISVDTDDHGVVKLTGTVPSEAARVRAVEIARSTKGVRRIEDHLQLKR